VPRRGVDRVAAVGVGVVAGSGPAAVVWRVGAAGAVAFALVTPTAGWILRVSQHPVPYEQLDFTAALLAGVFAVLVLPVLSWAALRLLRIDRAGLVVLSGWTAALLLVLAAAGGTRPAWVYGVWVGLGYALGALLTWPAVRPRTAPPTRR